MWLTADIGGTKIALVAYSSVGEPLWEEKYSTADLSPGSLLFLENLIDLLKEKSRPEMQGIGIAMKGLVRDGIADYASLLGGPVKMEMEKLLSRSLDIPVIVENDLYPQAIAERTFGSCKESDHFVVVNMGTGLSIAAMDGGRVKGFMAMAGQLSFHSHYSSLWQRNCTLEYLLGGKGVALQAEALGLAVSAREVLLPDAPEELLPLQRSVLHHLCKLLGEISYFLNPEKIIFTGSVATSLHPHVKAVRSMYRELVDEYSWCDEIEISSLRYSNCLGMFALLTKRFGTEREDGEQGRGTRKDSAGSRLAL